MDSLQWQEQYKFTANDLAASGANLGLSACQIQRRYFFEDYTQVNLTHEHCADIMSNFSSGSNRYDHAVSLNLMLCIYRVITYCFASTEEKSFFIFMVAQLATLCT
jgi:hypothetical protein